MRRKSIRIKGSDFPTFEGVADVINGDLSYTSYARKAD
jgi:hypothetical protein